MSKKCFTSYQSLDISKKVLANTHLRLVFSIPEQISISWLGRSISHHSGSKHSDQVGKGHLVGSAVGGHTLKVEDKVGQSVLVGRG